MGSEALMVPATFLKIRYKTFLQISFCDSTVFLYIYQNGDNHAQALQECSSGFFLTESYSKQASRDQSVVCTAGVSAKSEGNSPMSLESVGICIFRSTHTHTDAAGVTPPHFLHVHFLMREFKLSTEKKKL